MTANQRRPGFRLPWSSEMEDQGGEAMPGGEDQPMTPTNTGGEAGTAAEGTAPDAAATPQAEPAAEMEAPAVAPAGDQPAAVAGEPAVSATTAPPTDEFMRDLVAAMRGVADETRDAGLAELRTKADEKIRQLETDAESRRQELRDRAEQDVAGVGEWERTEQERITREAEQRVVARRAKLDQQLATETSRSDADTRAVRDRVAEYERELEAYHAQLIEINDPAAFAAAAKRMPKAPSLDAAAPATAPSDAPEPSEAPPAPVQAATAAPAVADDHAPVEPMAAPTNGVPEPEPEPEIHPAEQEVLAARLAELDATFPPAQAEAASAPTPAPTGETATTDVVVKGLGSFGAITGFRQALSGVDGIDAVALSLGQTGEFVFRATHDAGFDLREAIAKLEGDGAKVEDRPEGGLRVTLDRAR